MLCTALPSNRSLTRTTTINLLKSPAGFAARRVARAGFMYDFVFDSDVYRALACFTPKNIAR